MAFVRFETPRPLGDLPAKILLLVVCDDPPADIVDLGVPPMGRAGLGLQEGLHIIEQPLELDLVGGKLDLPPVAEAVRDAGGAAGRLRRARLEAAPIADKLIERLLPKLAGFQRRVGKIPQPARSYSTTLEY